MKSLPMTPELDLILTALKQQPTDRALDQLEPRVWAIISRRGQTFAPAGVWGWRAALVAAMVSVGALAGSAAVATPAATSSPFSIHPEFAPSTLIEGGS